MTHNYHMNEDPTEKVPSDKDENNNDKSENFQSDSVINTPKKKQLIRIKNPTNKPTNTPSDNVANTKKKLRIKSIDGKPVNPPDHDNSDTDTDNPKGRLLMVKEDDTGIGSYFKKYLDEHPDFFDDGAILEKQLQDDGMTIEIINDMFKTLPKHLIIDAIDRGVETSLQNWETKMKARRERINRNNNNSNTPQ